MSGLFVTASGTGIGKTYVTAQLVKELRGSGRSVEVLKPIITGYSADEAALSDAGLLLAALDKPVTQDAIEAMSPFRFLKPLAPDMAAAQENRTLDFDALVAFTKRAHDKDALLVEGVGGVMVPLDGHHTVRDWIKACDLPAVVVTGSYLGSLSHTLTACEALLNAGVGIAGVVLNESEGSTVSLSETEKTLHRFLPKLSLAVIERGHRVPPLAGLFGLC